LLSIKAQILPNVWRSQAWNILHTLLEMFVYRLHHIPSHYRVNLLQHLHTLSNVSQTNQVQLHLCMESTSLKLILGLSSSEILAIPQFSRFQNEPKNLLSTESEELNKALVLTLARAIHVTGAEVRFTFMLILSLMLILMYAIINNHSYRAYRQLG
jgi:mediator of RNA polymerase II transcription subunit 23